ncbi:hypothetical protein G9A89_008087 [Geosiphon pyriformis]|nr:hypothetical protein G9A89_008087 [Geosiphon pyriformis]
MASKIDSNKSESESDNGKPTSNTTTIITEGNTDLNDPIDSTLPSTVSSTAEKTYSEKSIDPNNDIISESNPNKDQDLEKGEKELTREISFDNGVVQLGKGQFTLVLIGLAFGVFLAALDLTIVATALPKIASDFNSLNQIAWVVTAYLLTTTAFQPTYGKMSDIFGRKAAFLFAILTFELGSLLCGIAPNIISMILFRAIAGIGGGGIFSMTMIIISDIVSLKDRGKYQGIIGACFGIASLVGPLAGGAFTDHLTWRWCFFINLPFGVITVLTVVFVLKLPKPQGSLKEKLKRIDWWGTITVILATVTLLLPLNWGGDEYAWDSPIIIALLILGGFFFILFGYIEGWIAIEPVASPRLFKNRTVVACFAVNLFQGMAFFSLVYYIPIYFQVIKGETATISGLELLPFVLGVVIASISSGQFISRAKNASKQILCLFGAAFITIGSGLISTLNEDSNREKQIGYLMIAGLGVGLIMQTTLLAGQAAVMYKDVAAVTSMLNFFRSIGSVFGVAIIGTIFKNELVKNLKALNNGIPIEAIKKSSTFIKNIDNPSVKADIIHAYVQALDAAFRVVIILGALCFISALAVGKNKSRQAEHDKMAVIIEGNKEL